MSSTSNLALSPATIALQAAALNDLRILRTQLYSALGLLQAASSGIPCDGSVDWIGPASDAFRTRGREIRASLQPALDDLGTAIHLLEEQGI